MVSILDVLCQPVLGPVDLLTTHRYLLLLKDDIELVVLHLVLNTGIVGNLTEFALFIIEMLLQKSLQIFKDSSIIRMLRYSKDLLEEDIMFSINLRIVSGKGFIPNIRFRHWMGQLSSVSKVSVHDVLSQPVLSPFDLTHVYRDIHLSKSFTEEDMLLFVVLAVVPGDVFGFTYMFFLMDEVFSHEILELLYFFLINKIFLHSSEGIKESNMFIIKIFVLKKEYCALNQKTMVVKHTYKDSKLFTPDIRFRNFVRSRKLVLIEEVCIFDVLCKPEILM